jgi:hypothetical protein
VLQARLDKARDRHIAVAAAESIATTRRRAMALERKRRLLDSDNASTVTIGSSTGIYICTSIQSLMTFLLALWQKSMLVCGIANTLDSYICYCTITRL